MGSRRTRILAWPASSLAAVLLGACTAEPSFLVRWSVEDSERPGQFPALTSARQCSSVGIGMISLETFGHTEGGTQVLQDYRERPCFPRDFDDLDASVAGPSLPAGDYVVVARGIRRDGISWTEALPEDCDEPFHGPVDCQDVTIEDGELLELDDFELPAPPQCEDGVDNDRDGLVDYADPGCQGDGDDLQETDDVEFVQLRLQTSVLNHNCNATCAGLGLSRIVVAVDDDDDDDDDGLISFACPDALAAVQLFNRSLATDVSTPVEVYGVDSLGERITTVKSFSVEPGQPRVDLAVDFADSDFLVAPEARLRFLVQFFGDYGEEVSSCRQSGGQRYGGCAGDPSLGLGNLVLDQVVIRVMDAHGQSLPDPVRLIDGTVLDGTPMPCATALLVTEPLIWGGYLVDVAAQSASGEVCFSTQNPAQGAPAEPFFVRPDRIIPPPPSCRDCEVDEDCSGATGVRARCVDNICLREP